jgi:hypothetical protein
MSKGRAVDIQTARFLFLIGEGKLLSFASSLLIRIGRLRVGSSGFIFTTCILNLRTERIQTALPLIPRIDFFAGLLEDICKLI